MNSKISQYTAMHIEEIINSNNLEKMEEAVFNLAESPEKLKLYDAIYDLEHANEER